MADIPTDALPLSGSSTSARRRMVARRLLPALFVAMFICALAGIVAAGALAGAQVGRQEAALRATATIAASLLARFEKANALMREGKYALAEANYAYILQYQPENYGVRQLIATAIAAQTPTPTPIPPTPTPVITDKGQLLALAREAAAAQDWDTVIRLTDQLAALDAAFEPAAVSDLRYRALVARGLSRLRGNLLEQGLYDLDRAAAIRPLSDAVEGERRLAAAYQSALYYFGADWERAIAQLEQLYRAAPAYRDVATRLREANARAGDAYAGAGDWCAAAKKYARAAELGAPTAEKRQDADLRCLAAASGGGSPGAGSAFSLTIPNVAGVSGRLFYSQYDPASYQYRYMVYEGAAGRAYQIGSGPQPSYRASLSPDRKRVTYAIFQDGWQVVVAPADGSGTPLILTSGNYPVWGPGGLIAYQGCTDFCGIHLIDPDQPGQVQRLTTYAGDINMQWSPSGDRLVYMSNFPGAWEIFIVTLNGYFQQLTGYGAQSGAPTFSPDGTRIAFISNRDGLWGVWVMNADGSNVTKLIDLGGQHPSWQSERLLWLP
jgi:tetratricopeptide (TPR) repeat protein